MTDAIHDLGERLQALPPVLKAALAEAPSGALAAQSFLMPRNAHPNSLRDHTAWLKGHPATPTGQAAILRILRGATRATPAWRGDALPERAGLLVLSHFLGGVPQASDSYYGPLLSAKAPGGPTVVAEINHSWQPTPDVSGTDHARIILARGVPLMRGAHNAWALRKAGRKLARLCDDRALASHVSAQAMCAANLFAMGLASQVTALVARLKPSAILMTWEGHPWERLAIHAAKRAHPEITCIAYHHAVLFPHQTATAQSLGTMFDPDLIVTSGAQAATWYRAQPDWAAVPVEVVGSPRGDGALATKAAVGDTVLVAPEGILDETLALFQAALDAKRSGSADTFALRLHPVLPRQRVLEAAPDLAELPDGVIWSEGALEQAFQGARAVLYRGSTVSVQALQAGLRPIYLGLDDAISTNPIDDDSGWSVRVPDGEALCQTLNEDRGLAASARDALLKAAQPAATSLFARSDPAKLTDLIAASTRQ